MNLAHVEPEKLKGNNIVKILIPLDGSGLGKAALPYITDLLSGMSPRVKLAFILLRVVSLRSHYVPVGDTATPIPYTEEEMEQIKRESHKYLEEVGNTVENKNINVELVVRTGGSAEEILNAADELEVDLIAMSTHGRHGISRWAFGSVTDKVLRAGRKPVLVLPVARRTETTYGSSG